MWTDPLVEELHQIRAEHAAGFDYDLAAIVEDLRQQEQKSGKNFVSLSPRLFVEKEKSTRAVNVKPKVDAMTMEESVEAIAAD